MIRKQIALGIVSLACLVFAWPAMAGTAKTPKILHGMVKNKKMEWQISILKKPGSSSSIESHPLAKMCTGNPFQAANPGFASGIKDDCKIKAIRDTKDKAVLESTCGDRTTRLKIKREGKKSLLVDIDGVEEDGSVKTVQFRYTVIGVCVGNEPKVSVGAGSEKCSQIQKRLDMVDPQVACAGRDKADREKCELRLKKSLKQISSMCD